MPEPMSGGRSAALVGSVLQPTVEPGVTSGSGRSPLAHELLAFAVGLLVSALKRGRFSTRDESHLALLEPLLPLLQRSMKADSDAVVALSLRTVGSLMSYPLPSLPSHATSLLERTLTILRRASSTQGNELVSIGIKVVTTLLRRPPVEAGGVGAGVRRTQHQNCTGNNGEDALQDPSDDDDNVGGSGAADEMAIDGVSSGGAAVDAPAASSSTGPCVGGGAALSESHLRWLITFVSVHLDDTLLQSSLFGLLRVIFGRKFVLPELYDLILVIGDMVLQADAPSVRSSCAQLFLTFLLRYPLGPKRLQQHLNFLITNISYPVAAGRASLLDLVCSLINHLPLPVLHRQSDLLLLPLVTRLVNDDNQGCRASVGAALSRLIGRTCDAGGNADCGSARTRLVKLLGVWASDASTPLLRRAAAQLAGLAVDALGHTTLAEPLSPMLIAACAKEAELLHEGRGANDADHESGAGGGAGAAVAYGGAHGMMRWQTAYYSLRVLLKLCAKSTELLLSHEYEALWKPLSTLMLHPHAWVRSTSGRVIGMLLASLQPAAFAMSGGDGSTAAKTDLAAPPQLNADDAVMVGSKKSRKAAKSQLKREKVVAAAAEEVAIMATAPISASYAAKPPPRYFQREGSLLELANLLIQQLQSSMMAEGAAAQALKNLLWVSVAFLQYPVELAPPSSHCCEQLLAGASSAAGGAFLAAAGAPSSSVIVEAEWPIQAIAARLVPLLQTPGSVRGSAAVRWYAAITNLLSEVQLRPMLPALLEPIARTAEDESGKVHLSVKELAAEVLQLLQAKAATPDFVAAYQAVKEQQRVARRERKQREALEAVADPAIAAQKRIAKNQGKRKQKKRKLEQHKRERDVQGSVGLNKKRRLTSTNR